MIDRTYAFAEEQVLSEEEYLSQFMNRALPPPIDEKDTFAEEDFLRLFVTHSQELQPQSDTIFIDSLPAGGFEVKSSRLISSYHDLDPGSGIGLIRLSSVVISTQGFSIFLGNTTLLCYSLWGEGTVTVNGQSLPCKKYDCVWIDCGHHVQYRALPGKPWECAFIRLHGIPVSPLFNDVCQYLLKRELLQLTFEAGTRFRSLIWQLLSSRTGSSSKGNSIYAHLLLSLFIEVNLAIISSAARQTAVPDIILAIQRYIETHYNHSLSLDELSRRFSISKFHMSREFKRYVGTSPNDYLIGVRLARAKELLINSRRSIADVAQLVGVPNENHFLYLFKSREGMTPSIFRKQQL